MREYIIRTDAELRVENGRFTLVYDGSCVHTDMVKELPQHGRLGDLDKLYEVATAPYGNFYGFQSLIKDIKNAPTVIEASDEDS